MVRETKWLETLNKVRRLQIGSNNAGERIVKWVSGGIKHDSRRNRGNINPGLRSPPVGEGVSRQSEVVGQVPDEILPLAPCAESEGREEGGYWIGNVTMFVNLFVFKEPSSSCIFL